MPKRSLRVLALASWLCLGLAPNVIATPFMFATGGYAEDFGLSGTTPDMYWIGNNLHSELAITRVLIELSTSAGGAFFDPAGSPFVVLGTDVVGFHGFFNLNGNQTLILDFTDFDPGETFIFGVETDDAGGGFTTGPNFAGALLTPTWGVSTVLTGSFVAHGIHSATAVAINPAPEPGTFGAVCLGLIVLSMGRSRSALARRRR
ncbi:MAG: hypothetical protein VCE43_04380 [Myxococcota bacterium]